MDEVTTMSEFRMGMLFDPETTNQLIELALNRDTNPYQLLKTIVSVVYQNQKLWEGK